MTDFNFDAGKKFTGNCVDFLESVKDVDPEMAAILEANWDKIFHVVREGDTSVSPMVRRWYRSLSQR